MRIKFDTRDAEKNFAKGLAVMGKLTGIDRKKIIMAEAGSILKSCAAKTKVATASQLQASGRLRALKSLKLTRGGARAGGSGVTINAGIKAPYGRVFVKNSYSDKYFRTHNDNFLPLEWRYAKWQKLNAVIDSAKNAVIKVVKQAKASAGIARGSWVRIADSLGIRLENVPGGGIGAGAISKARQAKAKGGKEVSNGTSRIESGGSKFFVTLINRLPYGRKLKLDGLLAVTVSNRAQYMYQSIAKGFRGSADDVAKRFPGWVVKGGVN